MLLKKNTNKKTAKDWSLLKTFNHIWKETQGKRQSCELEKIEGLSPLVADILARRGIRTGEEAKKFLNPNIEDFHNPFLLHGMDKAVERIKQAIENKEKVTIYGDYDVDGMTSVSVLLTYFRHINYFVNYYIPDRQKEGYGPNTKALKQIFKEGTTLVITVDCGIAAVEEVEEAKRWGLDVIITDHHECPPTLPDALSVIDPKLPQCSYPFDMLAGAGLAMKLVHGLMNEEFFSFLHQIIDLVALGTIADVAPLVDENRIIAKVGMAQMEQTSSVGLKALLEVARIQGKINTGHIGFGLGPRLNAAGRIGQAHLGVELLVNEDSQRAKELAQEMDQLNEKRRQVEIDILSEARKLIKNSPRYETDDVLVVMGKNWHTGVIGIVASRLSEAFYKPTVVLNETEDGLAKGSARSVGRFHMFEAMSSCRALFTRFGGHAQAAGLTLPVENVPAFRDEINKFAKLILTEKDKIPVLSVEEHLKGKDIHYELLEDLEKLAPFGVANPRPQFVVEGLCVDGTRIIGRDKKHVKFTVHDENRVFDALGFSMARDYGHIVSGDTIDVVASLEKNTFRGVQTIQLMMKDLRTDGPKSSVYKAVKQSHDLALATYLEQKALKLQNQKQTMGLNENQIFSKASECPLEKIKLIPLLNRLKNKEKNEQHLIVVNSFRALYTLCKGGHDQLDEMLKVHLNRIERPTGFDIVVYPITGEINALDYDFAWIYEHEEGSEETETAKRRMIPDRDDLVAIYKSVREKSWDAIPVETIENNVKKEFGVLAMSGMILRDLNLVRFSISSQEVSAQILPEPNKKIDIFKTHLFQTLQIYKKTAFKDIF